MKTFTRLLLPLLLLLSMQSKASHLYGGELYYTHISGNLYSITVVIYGDCSGTAFPGLPSSTPEINVYRGSTLVRTLYLPVISPEDGEEVTPVCFSSIDSTTCNGGMVPGVKKFVYADTLTLVPATNWRFRATGSLTDPGSGSGTRSAMGRSNSITNILTPGGTITALEATLNNNVQPNSNPTYTTIPTPFFCINVAQEYNQGAVDPNTSDSLVYALIDGLDGATAAGSLVSYLAGYSASAPLACATGTFSFGTGSGQLTFTPNLAQKSLVVGKVSEYRGGVLVGTSMREMTFIVLSTCSNRSPYGKVSSVSGGTAVGNTTVNICKDLPLLTFNINPVDSDGNTIAVTVTGLPTGATLSISGSGTKTPTTAFSWNTSSVAAGSYYFFVTYQDDGCPLSSKQTVAYTINVYQPTASFKIITGPTCVQKAVIDISPTSGASPWSITVLSGSTVLRTLASSGSVIRDSLAPGTYTFSITDGTGCKGSISYTILPPTPPAIDTIGFIMPTCNGTATGSIFIRGKGGNPPLEYSIDGGTYGSSGLFSAVFAGAHTLRIRDAKFCVKDTLITLKDIEAILLRTDTDRPLCNPYSDGSLSVSANGGVAPYQYAFGTSGAFGSITFWGSLSSDTYIIMVKDANNCIKEFPVIVEDSIVMRTAISVRNVSCFGGANGSFLLMPYIGRLPFEYAISGGSYGFVSTFSTLGAAIYSVNIRDGNGCILDTFVAITQPERLSLRFEFIEPKCFGTNTGSIRVAGNGGTPSYSFSKDSSAMSDTSLFTGLAAGMYKFSATDAMGCTHDTIVTLLQAPQLLIKVAAKNPLCNGDANGAVTVKGFGGTPAYLYSFNASSPGLANEFIGLFAGTYSFKVTDSNGCQKDTNIVLSQPAKIQFDSIKIKHPTCEGYADGAVVLKISGGTKPYAYSSDGFQFDALNPIENLKENSYSITVRDSNNCTNTLPISLVGYPKIKLDSMHIIPSRCYGTMDGAVKLYASGGNAPLRYLLEDTKDTIAAGFYKNMKAKTYTIKVIDRTNCAKDFAVPIIEPEPIKIKTELTHNDCTGSDNGSIKFLLSGGTRPYKYRWNNHNSSDSIISGLPVGFYTVMVSDAFNCSDSLTAEIIYDNCCRPGIPNAFSPNQDGKNDVFRILYQGGVAVKEFSVYNRYGQQVFSTDNITQGWDGTFNGQELDMGVYYYFIRFKCGNNMDRELKLKGDITLVR